MRVQLQSRQPDNTYTVRDMETRKDYSGVKAEDLRLPGQDDPPDKWYLSPGRYVDWLTGPLPTPAGEMEQQVAEVAPREEAARIYKLLVRSYHCPEAAMAALGTMSDDAIIALRDGINSGELNFFSM